MKNYDCFWFFILCELFPVFSLKTFKYSIYSRKPLSFIAILQLYIYRLEDSRLNSLLFGVVFDSSRWTFVFHYEPHNPVMLDWLIVLKSHHSLNWRFTKDNRINIAGRIVSRFATLWWYTTPRCRMVRSLYLVRYTVTHLIGFYSNLIRYRIISFYIMNVSEAYYS